MPPPKDLDLVDAGVRMRATGCVVLYSHVRLPNLALRASPLSVAISGVPCALAGEDLSAFQAALNRATQQHHHLRSCPADEVSVLVNATHSTRGAA